jgi:ATP-binding cassette subfamily B protein/subfamily B ATP-binding cassette protein MsbA
MRMSFPCASRYKVGDLTDYASQGPEAIRNHIEQTGQLLMNGLLLFTYLVVLVKLSIWLLLAALMMAGVIALVQRQLLPRLRRQGEMVVQTQLAISERITEDFQGLRLLHSSGQSRLAAHSLVDRLGDLEKALRYRSLVIEIVAPLATFLPVLAIALIGALAVLLLQSRSSGILPSLVTFVIALQRLNLRIAGVSHNLNVLADNAGRLNRLNQILSPIGKEFSRDGGKPFKDLKSGICFEAVSLRYSPDLPNAVHNICFRLPKGQMLALVGPSGAGKSSIADLLVGLYSPTGGRILVDGLPLACFDLASWQLRLGVVSQDTFLINSTLAENIAYGMLGATRADIEAAAEAAQVASFVKNLPEGYDTIVGERGYRLSGGQRQRIALARAILRQPEVLILDEATSALDTASELLVQQAIEHFQHNNTILVIAHRLSTIVRADQILVLQDGMVVEFGSHEKLVSEGGLYQNLWYQQSGPRIEHN